ncbi:GntR family transcriptional regulator [Kineococcus glutinatus]|uniref:GntR family transcriptional regulator n=1 Tax=Kineococcus glutinatus TaxID=1070872 RepID=A0ABP9HMM7_9ACTN
MSSSATGTAGGQQAARSYLREAITRGELAPGHRLVETDLVDLIGVSRGAVRLALDALTAEGLVERVPHRGARVRRVSTAEAVAITECRMALEGLLAARAAQRAGDEQVAALREQLERMRRAVAAGELMRYSDLVQELYELIRACAAQPVAGALVERLRAQIVRHQFRLSLRPGRPQVSLAGLTAVVEAIAERNPDAAEAAVRAHLAGVAAALREPNG